jgi:hypothetical protein
MKKLINFCWLNSKKRETIKRKPLLFNNGKMFGFYKYENEKHTGFELIFYFFAISIATSFKNEK